MVAVISENLKIFNAEQFKESVSEQANTKIYFTFGKGTAWANDSSPQQANSSVTSFNDVWDNMVGAKLISGNDIRHVIPRYDWSANVAYPAYDHCTCSLLLFAPNTPFYVVTSEWNVYKCIANNYGSLSTVMPTSLSTSATTETSDGYIWKYMYTISADERLKFTTKDFIPVKTLSNDDNSLQWDVQENAVPGALNSILVTNGGSNYSNSSLITISITGDGTGATATANVNTASNTVSSIIVTNPGRDYTYATVTISGPGTGATARAIISPPGGHGSDPLRELGGAYLILNPRLRGSEEGILPVNNEYRQISLISDPLLNETEEISSNTVISQLLVLTLSGVSSDYIEDERVYQGSSLASSTFSGRVYQWDSSNSTLKLTNTMGTPTTDIIIGENSTASRFVDSITNQKLKKYTGELLYINNIKPVFRDENQTEDYKIVFSF